MRPRSLTRSVVCFIACSVCVALGVATRGAAETFTFDTAISGDAVAVSVSLSDLPGGDGVRISLSLAPGTGDLLGLFGNVVDETLVPQMSVEDTSGVVTQWQFAPNQVWKVGGGNTMAPVKNWDWGVRLGEQGGAGGALESASFELRAPGLDVAQLIGAANQGWVLGVRAQDTPGPEGSTKLGLDENQPPDPEPPTLVIEEPADALLTNASPVLVSGSLTGTQPISVDVNGVAAGVLDLSFSVEVPLSEGSNELLATATNVAGSATDSVTVVLDTTPPAVQITAPPDGLATLAPSITVEGSVSDASAITRLEVAGQPATLVDGSFSETVSLALGTNTISVVADDAAGNSGQATVVVERGVLPTLSILEPVDGTETADEAITVSGTVTDAASVDVAGVAASVDAGTFTASVPLAVGVNTLVATATNAFGSASDSVQVTRVESSVQVEFTYPPDGFETTSFFLQAELAASSSAGQITSVTVNGSNASPLIGGGYIASVFLSTGENILTAIATDEAGNTGSASITVTLLEPIDVTISSPQPGALLGSPSVTVSGTAPGATAVQVNGVAASLDADTYSASIPLVEGANSIVVEASAPGKLGSTSIGVVLDTLPPEITIESPAEGIVTARDTVTVRGQASDPNGLSEVRVEGFSVGSQSDFVGTALLESGPNTIVVEAIDVLGHSASISVEVTRDPDRPLLLSIDTPVEGELVSSPRIEVAGSVTDPMADVTVGGTVAAVTGSQYVAQEIALAEGENLLTVTARRGAESVSESVRVTLNLPPGVQITSPSGGDVLRGDSADVSGVVDDPSAFVDVNGVVADVGPSGAFVARSVPLAPGENVLRARAVDLGGASATDAVAVVRADEAPPRLRIVLVDPARCPFPDDGACEPQDLPFADLADFEAGLATLGLPSGLFAPPLVAPALAGEPFEVFVFSEEAGDVALEIAGPGPRVEGAETPKPLEPVAGLGAAVAAAGLAPELADRLPPSDFPADFFARFTLTPVADPKVVTPTRALYGGFGVLGPDGADAARGADFDEDGLDDLVVAGSSSGGIGGVVYLSNGDDSFGPPQVLAVPAGQSLVATGDVDLDGHVDVAFASFNALTVLLGNGDGTFHASSQASVAMPSGIRRNLIIRDFTGDGKPDILEATTGRGVSLYRGGGNGTFVPTYGVTTDTLAIGVAAGDVDGDGDDDLAVAGEAPWVQFFLGDGSGGFSTGLRLEVFQDADIPRVQSTALADFDGDGLLDVAYSGDFPTFGAPPDRVEVRFGLGGGDFGPPVAFEAGRLPLVGEPADLDQDGRPDLIVTAGEGRMTLLRSLPGRQFSEETFPVIAPRFGRAGAPVAAADFNGDGFPDVPVPLAEAGVCEDLCPIGIFSSRGDGTLRGAQWLPFPNDIQADAVQDVQVADVSGDGIPDLVGINFGLENVVFVQLGRGDGTFAAPLRSPVVSGLPGALAAADFDEDGAADVALLVRSSPFRIELYRSTAGGALTPTDTPVLPGRSDIVPRLVAVDVDGDGHADLLTADESSYLLLRGQGDGTFGPAERLPASQPARDFNLADVTGDGEPDLVYPSLVPDTFDTELRVATGRGNGRFDPAQTAAFLGSPASASAAGDVNGDDVADVVLSFRNAPMPDGSFGTRSELRLLIADGSGGFEPPVTVLAGQATLPFEPASVVIADLDRDGHRDIATVDQNAATVQVLRGRGDGTFEERALFATAAGPAQLVAAELDGIGGLDLVVSPVYSTFTTVAVLLSEVSGAAPQFPAQLLAATENARDNAPVFLDRLAPAVSIASPTPGITLSGTAATLVGTVTNLTPAGADTLVTPLFSEVSYRVEDSLGVTLATGTAPLTDETFTIADVPLGVGDQCIHVEAVDAAGNRGNDLVCVTADPAAPIVTLLSPVAGQTLTATTAPLSLFFSADTTLVSINGVPDGRSFPAGIAGDVASLSLETGENVFDLALDSGGVTSTLSFSVFRADRLPGLRISSPGPETRVNTASVRVEGSVPPGVPLVLVNGVVATLDSAGTRFFADVPVSEGSNEIEAIEFLNGSSERVRVVRDSVPPALLALAPDSGSATPEASIAVAGRVSEPATLRLVGPAGSVSGSTFVAARSDGGSITLFDAFELPALALDPGSNSVTLEIVDRAGNQTQEVVEFERIEGALTLVSPAAGSTLPTLRADLELAVSEPVTLEAVYSAGRRLSQLEGLALPAGSATLAQVPLVSGETALRIVYRRESGTSGTLAFSLQSTASDVATLRGLVTDADTGEVIGGAQVLVTAGGSSFLTLSDDSGSFRLELEPGDLDGSVAAEGFAPASFSDTLASGETRDLAVVLDPTGLPALANEVEILVPPTGTVTDFERVTVVGTVLNPLSTVDVNGVPADVVAGRFTARGVPLSEGDNRIEVKAVAPGSPIATDLVAVERSDTPVPALVLYSPPDGARIRGSGLTIRGFSSVRGSVGSGLDETGIVSDGVFELLGVALDESIARLDVQLLDENGANVLASDSIPVVVESPVPAIELRASPRMADAPFESDLRLVANVENFTTARIAFDIGADGTVDRISDGSERVAVTEPRPLLVRVDVITPEAVEYAMAVRLEGHLPAVELGHFADGNPVALARDPEGGGLLVLDGFAAHIARFDAGGVELSRFGQRGNGPSELTDPQGLGLGPDGTIYVADTGNARIQAFDAAGTWLRSLGEGFLTAPRDVAFVDGLLVVVDAGDGTLRRFRPDGSPVDGFGVVDPASVTDVPGVGATVASPTQGLSVLTRDGLALVPGELGSAGDGGRRRGSLDLDVASGALFVATADGFVALLSPEGQLIREFEPPDPPRAVLGSSRIDRQTVYVADGRVVREFDLPVESPLPVLTGLKERLLAGDVEGALQFFAPTRRAFFEGIFTTLGPRMVNEGQSMETLFIHSLRARSAVGVIQQQRMVDGVERTVSYPVYLRRDEAGEWKIIDY